MQLILYIILPILANDIQNCTSNLGVNVFNIKVHLDTTALIYLRTAMSREFSSDFNTMNAAKKYFGGVFDQINEELEPYGVQVRGDFTELKLEKSHVPYDQTKCKEGDIHLRTNLALNRFLFQGTVGNRLVVFYCKKIKDGKSFSTLTSGTCDSVTGVIVGNLRDLSTTIRRELVRGISRNIYESDGKVDGSFNGALCSQARKCMVNNIYGEFVKGLKNIRHLASEHYITGKGFRIREHDLYDDVEGASNGDPDIYPTQDYSNDNELYEDNKGGITDFKKALPF